MGKICLLLMIPFVLTSCVYVEAEQSYPTIKPSNILVKTSNNIIPVVSKPKIQKSPEISIGGFVVQEASPPFERAIPVVENRFKKVRAVVTAYCPCTRCCGPRARGRTALGTNAWKPGIAADWKCFPAGTVLNVPEYGESTVDDNGGDMRQAWRRGEIHIDVRFNYHWEARQWGRQILEVFIISIPGEENVRAR